MRLIDADAVEKITWQDPSYTDPLNVLTEVREKVRALPTIDAVPVIRCKDCRYYDHGENPSESWSLCIVHINRYFQTCAENYCAWAERKE